MRPNLLFIMTDQQRFDAMSAHGGWIQTPVLDALAKEGVDLQRHFSQAPVCVPSRSSLFTGRYPHAHGVLENDARLAPHEVHLLKVLKQNGYDIGYVGKNHLLPDEELRANARYHELRENGPDVSAERAAYVALEQASLERLRTHGSFASGAYHDFDDNVTTTGIVAAKACELLNEAPAGQPWCVVASFSDPHVPHLAPRRFERRYPPESVRMPAWKASESSREPPRLAVKRGAQKVEAATEAERRRYLSIYGAMCSFVDEQVGLVLETLRRRPDAERTIIVFVSDHGDFCWHHGLCKKDLVLYDDLLHVPAVIHWPRQLAPTAVAHTLSEHVDIMPTLLELAEIPFPFGCQGRSLVPLLRGKTAVHREEIHGEVCYPWMRSGYATFEAFRRAWDEARAKKGEPVAPPPYNVPGDYTKCVRTARWKYIWFGDGFEELYDLQADPAESMNRADDAALKPVLAELRLRLLEWAVLTADPRSPATEKRQLAEFDRWNFPANA